MNFIEDLGIVGYLQIAKVYKDKPEEIVFDDHNIIVSGMSVGLSHLFSGSGSNNIIDYQFDKFQLGLSGNDSAGSGTYELSGPLSSIEEYGGAANFAIISAIQIKDGSFTTSQQIFGRIPFKNVTKINDASVRYTILVDEDTANYTNYAARHSTDQVLTEIGLFMKNPRGEAGDASILVAYRKFTQILKTSDFALVFRWTINF